MARWIKPSFHFHQDNVLASVFILGPFFFTLGTLASYLSWISGVYLFLYNALTDRPGSLAPVLSENPVHRILDYSGIAGLLILPWILFSVRLEQLYFFIQGAAAAFLVLFVDFTPQSAPRPPFLLNAFRYVMYIALTLGVVYLGLSAALTVAKQSSG